MIAINYGYKNKLIEIWNFYFLKVIQMSDFESLFILSLYFYK